MQLNSFELFLFGSSEDVEERPPAKCLEDSAAIANETAKYAVERIIRIKQRLGVGE